MSADVSIRLMTTEDLAEVRSLTNVAFGALVAAAEHLSKAQGLNSMIVRTPGSNRATIQALQDLGYRAGRVMVRMKTGNDLDYDKDRGFYLDNWL